MVAITTYNSYRQQEHDPGQAIERTTTRDGGLAPRVRSGGYAPVRLRREGRRAGSLMEVRQLQTQEERLGGQADHGWGRAQVQSSGRDGKWTRWTDSTTENGS